ncbi:MAG: hypothetical protein K0R18_2685 [Bacillales bacterium]|nr:hypothetical protein [Bacillales bacterium]
MSFEVEGIKCVALSVTILVQKINVTIQIVLSLRNIAQDVSNQMHIAKQNNSTGHTPVVFFLLFLISNFM